MSAVAIDEPVDRATTEAGQALHGLTRLRLAGPLTAATAPQLRARIRDVLEHGHPRVVVDLQAVTGLDAAGLAVLLDARRMLLAQAGGTLVLRANGIVCRALKETGTIAAFALSHGSGM
jgi:anti-sigma B factor antagonist